MTKRQFVTICFRMFAVYLAVVSLTNIPYIYYNTYGSLNYLGGPNVFGVLMSIILMGLSFILPWLFWKKSDYLMLKVFGDKDFFIDAEGKSQSNTNEDGVVKFSFSADEVLQIGFVFLGCWIIAETVFPSLTFIITLINTDTREYYFSSEGAIKFIREAADTIGKFILGYFLIRNPNTIISRINKLRTKDL